MLRGWLTMVAAAVALAAAGSTSARVKSVRALPIGHGGFATAVMADEFGGADTTAAFGRAAATGASGARLVVDWANVAPGGATKPTGFDAADEADPLYNWSALDESIAAAVAAGLQPIVAVADAPRWTQAKAPLAGRGPYLPSPAEFGLFARAIATRYDGSVGGLPRVRYWQAWNEPNISLFVSPQLAGGRPLSPAWYRSIVNGFAASVKAVHADNVVIAGGLAPFRDITPEIKAQRADWGPLSFMRELLCLKPNLTPSCHTPIAFDVWATHPYTSGGPTHHAVLPDDVSLGDLPEMKRTLDAAVKAHIVRSAAPPGFWVTEFSWDSSPPDPHGVPIALLERWVPEALYRMWASGVSLVTWYGLRDHPLSTSFYQSGLYARGLSIAHDRPKPFLQGFRFPFVAFPAAPGRTRIWGFVPGRRPADVLIERRVGSGGFRRVRVLRSNSSGVFSATLRVPSAGSMRARAVGQISLPFSLTPVKDRFFNPFGQPTLLEPSKK